MIETFFGNSVFLGVSISLLSYSAGMYLKSKWKLSIFNPLLISIILTMIVLTLFNISYDTYYASAHYLSYLLTPATVALAIPLYDQLELLKTNWKAVFFGVLSGVITSLSCVFLMALLFALSHEHYVTLLPKSITTAMAIGVSEELGGYIPLTVASIVVTGIFGNVISDFIFRIFKISDPIAKGIALGTSSHVIGTSKAMELGEVEGAMSSLSIVVAGLLTVIGASIFAQFL